MILFAEFTADEPAKFSEFVAADSAEFIASAFDDFCSIDDPEIRFAINPFDSERNQIISVGRKMLQGFGNFSQISSNWSNKS